MTFSEEDEHEIEILIEKIKAGKFNLVEQVTDKKKEHKIKSFHDPIIRGRAEAVFKIQKYAKNPESLQKPMEQSVYKSFKGEKNDKKNDENKDDDLREFAALLCGVFAVDDYGLKASKEKLLLDQMQNHLKNLYFDYLKDTKNNINGLFTTLNDWLKLGNDELGDKEQAEQFCRSIHTILSIIEKKLLSAQKTMGVTPADTAVLMATGTFRKAFQDGLTVTALLKETDALRSSIATKQLSLKNELANNDAPPIAQTTVIQEQKAPPAVETTTAPEPIENSSSLREHLNQQFLNVLNSSGSEKDNLKILQNLLSSASDNLDKLIDQRKEKAVYETIMQELKSKQGTQKEQSNAPVVQEADQPEKKHAPPLLLKKVLQFFVAKKAASPTIEANSVVNPLIKKHTSTSKEKEDDHEINMAEFIAKKDKEAIKLIGEEIDTINKKIGVLEAKIAPNNPEAVSQTTTATLEQILCATKQINEAVSSYTELFDKIQLIEQAKGLDSFIQRHNTWGVLLSNMLAKISSFFKTDTARAIDEARILKNDVALIQTQCESVLASLNKNTNDQQNKIEASQIVKSMHDTVLKSSSVSLNSVSDFKNFKQQFHNITDPSTAVNVKIEQNQENEPPSPRTN